jgi:hypothetical protein
VRRRVDFWFWAEATLAGLSAALVLLTAIWHDWVEGIFGVDPDHHDGGFEWQLAIVCVVLAVAFSRLARDRWRKAALANGALIAGCAPSRRDRPAAADGRHPSGPDEH